MRFRRKTLGLRVAVLLVLCFYGANAVADEPVDSALKRLSPIDIFSLGPVGYAGVTSKGEVDFNLILSKPNATALDAFENLYRIGDPPAKLYALAGIKKLNSKRFAELLASLKSAGPEVVVMRGCIVSHEPFRDVAQQIGRRKFKF